MTFDTQGVIRFRANCRENRASCVCFFILTEILSDFINMTQVHNFTVSAQDIFTFRRLSVFTVSFTRILHVLMQIMKCLHCTTD